MIYHARRWNITFHLGWDGLRMSVWYRYGINGVAGSYFEWAVWAPEMNRYSYWCGVNLGCYIGKRWIEQAPKYSCMLVTNRMSAKYAFTKGRY